MGDKFDSRTPAMKRKQFLTKPTPTKVSKLHVEFTPNKRSRQDVNKIEDEEFPRGFTLLETINTPSKFEEKHVESQPSKENSTNLDLTLVSHFDELIRHIEEYFEDDLTEEFLAFAEHQELCRLEWQTSVQECNRLREELDKANHEIGDFANKLKNARRLLDQEKKVRRRVEEERNCLEQQMLLARDLLFSEKCTRIPDDTKEKLAFLNNTTIRSRTSVDKNHKSNGVGRLNTINEINSHEMNSTGSLLSDFSYSRSEDNLDSSAPSTLWRHQKCLKREWWQTTDVSSPKKRRSSTHKVEINPTDKIVATTTLSVSKDGGVVATSVIDAVPETESTDAIEEAVKSAKIVSPKAEIIEKLWLKEKFSPMPTSTVTNITRQHTFVSKTVLCPDKCGACNTRIGFGRIVLKCKDCRGICHEECKIKLPLPCIPLMNTPTQKGKTGSIADYVPSLPPLVPSLLVHCINEVELRGLTEVGLYRVPGSEKDVKTLKEKFLRSKTTPSLNNVDVHVICGVIKDFLRSLRESLVTSNLRKDFIKAVELNNIKTITAALYQALSQLPQANRDTLSYIMLHLNKVAESKSCKMPAENLAKIFAPTIIGYSSEDIEPQALLTETAQQFMVMDHLMKIPIDFWASHVNVTNLTPKQKKLLQTPSTEIIQRTNFFTPHSSKSQLISRKRKKFFATPPSKK